MEDLPMESQMLSDECIKYINTYYFIPRVEDLPMESQMLSDALDTAQKRVENYFFDIRK